MQSQVFGAPSTARSNSSNAFANGADQNCGNFITDRPTTRLHAPPGGQSQISFGGGDFDAPAVRRPDTAAFAAKGIRVNALAPGTVMTDMVRNNTPEAVESMQRAAFMRRGADPDEMVGPALLLCSDAGSFITGQALIADGGLTPH